MQYSMEGLYTNEDGSNDCLQRKGRLTSQDVLSTNVPRSLYQNSAVTPPRRPEHYKNTWNTHELVYTLFTLHSSHDFNL